MIPAPSVLTSPAVPSWLVAGGSLLVGFVVAQATGVRALGGLVLLAGMGWCWLLWRERAGTAVAAGLSVAYGAAFVLSHVIAGGVGAVPAVLLVAAAVAGLAFALVDARYGSQVSS